MREEIIVSGRLNPHIDPILHIWGWEIPAYLFLGGLAAGILFFASYFYLTGKENDFKASIKIAPMFTPFILSIGLLFLFIDLSHKLYFWRLYTTIRIESPMSWGAWILMIVTPLSIIWSATYLKEIFPKWDWKFKIIDNLLAWFTKQRKPMAWILLFSSIILGIYTGILLSAFNARPLWNTSILGPLFLTSGLSAGAAFIMMISKNKIERTLYSKIDLGIIGVEMFFIVHMFMGFLASSQAQIDAANLFLGGEYTLPFWVFVVFLGMIVPAILEIMELRGKHIPAYLPSILIISGSLLLRLIIVYAGQASRYLY
ncbi:MAG: nitrite reductase [Bacteroidetes bacterium GWF2_33_38]|nr:MAG: nitrite reductase [Bacteroidetes bacterium GWF2_33_38]OFY91040.1 MAG: nitrite reductase [Bacteroidetes bacterium RIFOXYA2_FULL_33_7]